MYITTNGSIAYSDEIMLWRWGTIATVMRSRSEAKCEVVGQGLIASANSHCLNTVAHKSWSCDTSGMACNCGVSPMSAPAITTMAQQNQIHQIRIAQYRKHCSQNHSKITSKKLCTTKHIWKRQRSGTKIYSILAIKTIHRSLLKVMHNNIHQKTAKIWNKNLLDTCYQNHPQATSKSYGQQHTSKNSKDLEQKCTWYLLDTLLSVH